MTASVFPIVIAEWRCNDRGEVVRVSLDRYGGRHTLDVRVWYASGDQLKPGRAGITISIKHLPAMAKALADASLKASEIGLLDLTKVDSRPSSRVRDQRDGGGDGGG